MPESLSALLATMGDSDGETPAKLPRLGAGYPESSNGLACAVCKRDRMHPNTTPNQREGDRLAFVAQNRRLCCSCRWFVAACYQGIHDVLKKGQRGVVCCRVSHLCKKRNHFKIHV